MWSLRPWTEQPFRTGNATVPEAEKTSVSMSKDRQYQSASERAARDSFTSSLRRRPSIGCSAFTQRSGRADRSDITPTSTLPHQGGGLLDDAVRAYPGQACWIGYLAKIASQRLNALSIAASGVTPFFMTSIIALAKTCSVETCARAGL